MQNTQTMQNLMRAYAGESLARSRYSFAAQTMETAGLQALGAIFRYTAGQEKEHAEIFADFLRRGGAEAPEITAGFPVDLKTDPLSLLEAAVRNESAEETRIYPAFAAAAREEGFAEIAAKWEQIAAIEKTHAERFEALRRLLAGQALFASDQEERWVCLNCGHVIKAKAAPEQCPVCRHAQGYFLRADQAPYPFGA